MPFKVPRMKDLVEKGLNLQSYYQRHFLYVPQPSTALKDKFHALKTSYLKSKEIEDAPKTREPMLDFLVQINAAVEKIDKDNEEGITSRFKSFWSKDSPEEQQKEKEIIDRKKSWILTGALLFIRFKIRMEYKGWLWSGDPNNSTLYVEIGKVLCPKEPLNIKPLYDEKTSSIPNYFAMVQALSALQSFIDKMETKPDYLTQKDKAHRTGQLGTFLKNNEEALAETLIVTHLKYLDIQEKIVESIDTAYQMALTEIEKMPKESLTSFSQLKRAVGELDCHQSVKVILAWVPMNIDIKDQDKTDPYFFEDKVRSIVHSISAHAIVGAQYLLKHSLSKRFTEDHESIITTLDDAMGNTMGNEIDFSNSDDVVELEHALFVYEGLVPTLPNKEIHRKIWGHEDLENVIKDTTSEIKRVSKPAAMMSY